MMTPQYLLLVMTADCSRSAPRFRRSALCVSAPECPECTTVRVFGEY